MVNLTFKTVRKTNTYFLCYSFYNKFTKIVTVLQQVYKIRNLWRCAELAGLGWTGWAGLSWDAHQYEYQSQYEHQYQHQYQHGAHGVFRFILFSLKLDLQTTPPRPKTPCFQVHYQEPSFYFAALLVVIAKVVFSLPSLCDFSAQLPIAGAPLSRA